MVGINGKGLMVVNLCELFMVDGLMVGIFMLLFIVCFNEWISVDGIFISDEEFVGLV